MATTNTRLQAALGLDISEFEAGISGAIGLSGKLQKALNVVAGSFVIGGMASFIKSAGNMAEQILNTADSLGVGTDFLQDWNRTADLSGIGAEKATNALEKLSIKIGEGAEAFKKYNIALSDSKGLRATEDILKDVAALINGTADGAERAALAVEFFGKIGQKILPLLATINNLETGFRLTRLELENLDRAGDAITRLGKDAQIGGSMILNFFTHDIPAAMGELTAELQTGHVESKTISDLTAQMDAFEKRFGIGKYKGKAEVQEIKGSVVTIADRAKIDDRMAKAAVEKAKAEEAALDAEQQMDNLMEKRNQATDKMLAHTKGTKEQLEASADIAELDNKINAKGLEISKKETKEKERQLEVSKKIADEKKKNVADGWAGMDAFGDLNQAKLDRSKFSLEELANYDARGTSGQFRRDIFAARDAKWMEDQGKYWKGWDEKKSQDFFNQADALKKSIVSLNSNERNPFESLEKAANSTAEDLSVLLAGFESGAYEVKVLGAK